MYPEELRTTKSDDSNNVDMETEDEVEDDGDVRDVPAYDFYNADDSD